jgi:hypothetical protein
VSKPFNKVLARYPLDERGPVLWELPGQGVYLGCAGNVNLTRVCSKEQFLAGVDVLVEQGWIVEVD